MNPRILRVGIKIPVGSGKVTLTKSVENILAKKNYRVFFVSNNVI